MVLIYSAEIMGWSMGAFGPIAGAVIGILLVKSFLLKGQIKLEEESH